MTKKIKIILICLIIFSILIICFILFNKKQNGSEENKPSLPISYQENKTENEEKNEEKIEQNEQSSQEQNTNQITEIMQTQGLQANEDIYEIVTEYDGRKALTVKANIKFKTALAGAIKKDIPQNNEIDSLLEKAPTHTGIWIEETSREKFLNILKNIANSNYEIDEQGFLVQNITWNKNKYDNGIKQMLSNEVLYIFDFSSITYVIDEVTGEIQEYPFEDMDPYTEYEYFCSDNKEMFVISSNLQGLINQEDILKNIICYKIDE